MAIFEKIHEDNYEQIVYCHDTRVGLKAIISMHNTVLGPSTGGCRMWNYRSEEEALTDVLRLSKGMTYKASISRLPLGGGKSVIIGDPATQKTPALLQRFGEFVEKLGGNYITAKDVGIDSKDLKIIKSKTRHILGIEGEKNSSGDPSPVTAWGVYNGIKACAKRAFGTPNLKDLHIVLQGLGSVNYHLAKLLSQDGVTITACDINQQTAERARREFNLTLVEPKSIFDIPCDVFSPGALGAVINHETIGRLKCKIIAGAANNQLATEADGRRVFEKGFIYAPDYAINAGGLINIYHELEGYNRDRAWNNVARIYDTIEHILKTSVDEKLPTNVVADKIAQSIIKEKERVR